MRCGRTNFFSLPSSLFCIAGQKMMKTMDHPEFSSSSLPDPFENEDHCRDPCAERYQSSGPVPHNQGMKSGMSESVRNTESCDTLHTPMNSAVGTLSCWQTI